MEEGNESLNESHIIAVSEESVAELFDILPGAGSERKETEPTVNTESEEKISGVNAPSVLAAAISSAYIPSTDRPAATPSTPSSNGPVNNHTESRASEQRTSASKPGTVAIDATSLNSPAPTTTPISSKTPISIRRPNAVVEETSKNEILYQITTTDYSTSFSRQWRKEV